jgi:hypothetical protein
MSAAEIAHRSLAHDVYTSHNSHSRAYINEAERYSDRYTTYYPSHEPDYSLIQKKKKKKADDIRVQRGGDELLFVRKKGKEEENDRWKKTEKEVEWLRGRCWM